MAKKISRYLTEADIRCRCGCGKTKPDWIDAVVPEYEDLRKLLWGVFDLLRKQYPVVITSAYRCEVQNARVGGATYSPHIFGIALDIAVPLEKRQEIVEYLLMFPFLRVGHKKYANKQKHIHIDVAAKIADDLYRAGKIPLQARNAYRFAREW